MPAISVVIPVYNVEEYLEESLNSILNQTFKDFEVICINDGSTDNSLSILNKFKEKDIRIKIINQKNLGNGGARNTGLRQAIGDYVYFFDADDLLLPNALELMYENAVSNQSDLVIFKTIWMSEGESLNYTPVFPLDEEFSNVDFNNFTFTYKDIKYYVMNNSSFAVWAKFYKKEFLDKHVEYLVFPEHTAFADVRFHIASMILASRISFLNEFLYKYRLTNPNSVTNNKSNRWNIFPVVDSVEEFLIKSGNFNEFENDFAKFKIYQLLHHLSTAESRELFFEKIQEEFLKLDIVDLTLPKDYKGRYQLVIDSKDYSDYLHNLIFFDEIKNNKYHIISNSKEITKLKRENKKIKKEIKEIKSSNSWKITKPLRKIKQKGKGV